MRDADFETALLGRLGNAGIAGLQLLFPNVTPDPNPPVKPYAVVTLSLDGIADRTLAGQGPICSGRLLVVVVTEEGGGTVQPNALADQIRALYPCASPITFQDGEIRITRHPERKTPYAQGGAWRTPVEITFTASTT